MVEKQQTLIGLEKLVSDEDEDEASMQSAAAQGGFFDASALPDAPDRQRVAHGNQTYVLYVIFATYEEMVEGLQVLTGGSRKAVAKNAKLTTLSSLALQKKSGIKFIDYWKKFLPADEKK